MLTPFIVGNWKMNLGLLEARDLAKAVRDGTRATSGVDVGVCPAFIFLVEVYNILKGSNVVVGAQNMHWENSGAFTGEVSGQMLKDIGCTHVILGHSERRHKLGETDSMINAKLKTAFRLGLRPIFCLGEILAEREAGKTIEVVKRQLLAGLEGLNKDDIPFLTIAYEPVWAIGTGRNATPEQAQEVHGHIRGLLSQSYGEDVAFRVRLQYGGSVTPENAGELLAQPDVNGLLVGGSSLRADSFLKIVSLAYQPVTVRE